MTAAEVRKEIEETLCIINPLNAELNPICQLLALLGAHHILHVNRVKVNNLLAPELFFLILAHSVYKM